MKYIFTVLCSLICMNFFAQAPVVTAISGPSVVCTGLTVTYTVSATNTPTSYPGYMVSSPASINGNADSLIAISFVNPGTYTLYCSATNSVGSSPYFPMIITVFETPSVNFSGSNTFCQGSSTNLSASSTVLQGSPTISYSWAPPTGLNTTMGQHVVANPATATNYTVTATNGGCAKTGTITVTPFEQLSVTFSGANTFCQGSATNLSASSTVMQASSTISYNWSPAYGLNTTTGANVLANPANATTYTVTAFYGTCSTTGQITITELSNPTVTAVASRTAVCNSDTITFNAYGANTYTWNYGIQNGVPYHTWMTGNYVVTGTGANGCTGTASVNIVVDNIAVFYVNSTHQLIVAGDTATLTFHGGANTTYSLNGVATSTSVAISPTVTTTYTITSSTPSGCEYTSYFTQAFGFITGVETIKAATIENYFKVFPNPSNGVFNIRSNTKETVSIINQLGEIVNVFELSPDTDQQISGLSSGIYLITTGKTNVKIIVTQ